MHSSGACRGLGSMTWEQACLTGASALHAPVGAAIAADCCTADILTVKTQHQKAAMHTGHKYMLAGEASLTLLLKFHPDPDSNPTLIDGSNEPSAQASSTGHSRWPPAA